MLLINWSQIRASTWHCVMVLINWKWCAKVSFCILTPGLLASAGGADALVTMLKSNARHHRDGAVYALAGLMDRNVDAVRHAFAHSQGQLPPTAEPALHQPALMNPAAATQRALHTLSCDLVWASYHLPCVSSHLNLALQCIRSLDHAVSVACEAC